MKKVPMRRFTDTIRLMADAAFARGSRETGADLHEVARKAEALRGEEKHGNQ
jgi:hypothetical protein